MFINKFLFKCRHILALSSLSILVACGGGGDTDNSDDSNFATYNVEFNATWGPETHPTNIPSGIFPDERTGPHFSPIVVVSHNDQVILWENGQRASVGTTFLAEDGFNENFIGEADAAIRAGTAGSVAEGRGGFSSPGSQSISIEVNSNFPRITFITMIAPSPDWFGGANIDSILVGGEFVDSITVDVLAYDAGTDSGVTYLSSNEQTSPLGVIQPLFTDPIYTSFNSETERKVGTLTLTKQ